MSVDLTSIPEDLQYKIICESDGQFICSEAVQDRVIEKNPAWLDRIDSAHTTEKFIAAIRKYPSYIENFVEPPLPWQEAVLDADMSNILRICHAEPTLITAYLEHLAGVPRSNAVDVSDDIKRRAVANDWRAMRYIKDPDEDMRSLAVKQSWEALRIIDEPSISEEFLVCGSAEAVKYLLDSGNLYNDEELITLAKKTLLDALTRGTPSEMDSEYRRVFLELADEEEVLEILSGEGMEPAFEPRDFTYIPSDSIKKKVVKRLGLRKYSVQAQGRWLAFPGFRLFLAGHRDGRLYGYFYLGETDDDEKSEFIKLLAGDSTSNDPLRDEETCERAIRQSDISIIHTVFSCLPNPSDAVCKSYLAVLAVERGMTSISPVSLGAAEDLIRNCPDSGSSLQVAQAASRFNECLHSICNLSVLMSDNDEESDGIRVGHILKGIAAAINQDATDAIPLGTVGANDIDMDIV